MIDVVWRLPAEHLLGTFCNHTLEAHACYLCADVIVVDERRVAEHLWTFAEEFLNAVAHALHFSGKTLLVGEGGQSVAVRLTKELNLSCGIDLVEEVNDLWCMELKLFQTYTREGEGNPKFRMILTHLDKRLKGRHITTFGDVIDRTLVLVVVVVIMVATDVKKTVALEMDDLVYLKIKTNLFHDPIYYLLYSSINV